MISVLMPTPALSPLSAPQAAHLLTQHRESSHTDKMLPALCSLFTALSCVSGVTVVTQKPPVLTPTKGETTTMHCNLGTVTGDTARWYKQVPGEAPHSSLQSLLYLLLKLLISSLSTESSHTDKMLPALCSLFTALSCVSGVTVVTQKPPVLTPTKGEKITMHCNLGTVTDSSARTKLIVTDSAVPAPVLTIFPPSSEELKSNKATLVCLANDVSSGFADVRWLVDGNVVSSGVTTGSAAQQPNKKFRLSSYLTIERSEWDKDKAITCEVSAASKATTKEIKKSECSD
ncbi:hypothetical protein SRHO_G00198900 [Serrasalmus rhombeus]